MAAYETASDIIPSLSAETGLANRGASGGVNVETGEATASGDIKLSPGRAQDTGGRYATLITESPLPAVGHLSTRHNSAQRQDQGRAVCL